MTSEAAYVARIQELERAVAAKHAALVQVSDEGMAALSNARIQILDLRAQVEELQDATQEDKDADLLHMQGLLDKERELRIAAEAQLADFKLQAVR